MITAAISFNGASGCQNDQPSERAVIALQQWLKGDDGAKIIIVASEAEAVEKSAGDTKNFYVWE